MIHIGASYKCIVKDILQKMLQRPCRYRCNDGEQLQNAEQKRVLATILVPIVGAKQIVQGRLVGNPSIRKKKSLPWH